HYRTDPDPREDDDARAEARPNRSLRFDPRVGRRLVPVAQVPGHPPAPHQLELDRNRHGTHRVREGWGAPSDTLVDVEEPKGAVRHVSPHLLSDRGQLGEICYLPVAEVFIEI